MAGRVASAAEGAKLIRGRVQNSAAAKAEGAKLMRGRVQNSAASATARVRSTGVGKRTTAAAGSAKKWTKSTFTEQKRSGGKYAAGRKLNKRGKAAVGGVGAVTVTGTGAAAARKRSNSKKK